MNRTLIALTVLAFFLLGCPSMGPKIPLPDGSVDLVVQFINAVEIQTDALTELRDDALAMGDHELAAEYESLINTMHKIQEVTARLEQAGALFVTQNDDGTYELDMANIIMSPEVLAMLPPKWRLVASIGGLFFQMQELTATRAIGEQPRTISVPR